jgi:hypothetical protein
MNNRFVINLEELTEANPVDVTTPVAETPAETAPIVAEEVPDEGEVEHERLALELENEFSDINRDCEVAEGLESLAYIASRLDKPTIHQVDLFRVAANMAVAGTNRSAGDFLPSMESNKPIALEGFADSIKDTVKTIIEKLKEWWKKFLEFIDKNIFSLKTRKERFEEAAKKLKEAEELEEQKEINPVVHFALLTDDQSKKSSITLREIESNILEVYKLKPILDNFAKGYDQLIDKLIEMVKNTKSKEEFILARSEVIKEYNDYIRLHLENKIDSSIEYITIGNFIYKNYGTVDFDQFYFHPIFGYSGKMTRIKTTTKEFKTLIQHIEKEVLLETNKTEKIYGIIDMCLKSFSAEIDPKLMMLKTRYIENISREVSNVNKLYINYSKVIAKIYDQLTSTMKSLY